MDKLKQIEKKIEQLQEKKKKEELKKSITLRKKLQDILKDDFNENIILTLVKEAWNKTPAEQKEEWKKSTRPF